MAKEYYTMEEAADVLGMTKDQVAALVRQGKLAEHEENGQTVFRIEDVERIVANEGSSIVDLDLGGEESSEVGELEGLSVSEPTSDINLLGLDESSIDLDLGPSPVVPAAPKADAKPAPSKPAAPLPAPKPAPSSEPPLAEPSDLDLAPLEEAAHDIGLSASDVIALNELDEKPANAQDDTRITAPSVSVFDDSGLSAEVDPLAKTRITPAVDQEVALDSVGSGSGLLDLTRESDDTSLGAELLDVISPTESAETETAAETIESDTGTLEAEAVETADAVAYEEQPEEADQAAGVVLAATGADPSAPAFTGLAVVATIALAVVGLSAASQIQGVWPEFMRLIDSGTNLYVYFGATLGLAGVAWLVGWMIGRSAARKPAKHAGT